MYDAVQTLIKRDKISLEEAKSIVAETLEECLEAIESGEGDPEEIWMDSLGLEPDYLYPLLPF